MFTDFVYNDGGAVFYLKDEATLSGHFPCECFG